MGILSKIPMTALTPVQAASAASAVGNMPLHFHVWDSLRTIFWESIDLSGIVDIG
jgi:hypothetical protein